MLLILIQKRSNRKLHCLDSFPTVVVGFVLSSIQEDDSVPVLDVAVAEQVP